MYMAVEILRDGIPGFVRAIDVSEDLAVAHPNWQEVLCDIARQHAEDKTTNGENDPTSRMEPGAEPVTASRVHPRTVAREAPWFTDFCRTKVVGLARIVFGADYQGAGDDITDLFDFNVADLSETNSAGAFGEPHVDSPSGAGLICVSAGIQAGYAATQFAPDAERLHVSTATELRLHPGEVAFFNGNKHTHRAVERVPESQLVTPALRVTVAVNFWGEGEYNSEQRELHNATLYP